MSKDLSNLIKRIGSIIPGFVGYETKESLRKTDYQIRLHVKQNLERLIKKIERDKLSLNDEDLMKLDKAQNDLKVFNNRVINQVYGYDALMDRKEDNYLEDIISNDSKMLDIIESINFKDTGDKTITDLHQKLDELLMKRQDILR
tara:strand:+ start:120 stop:554 length:435 start_codon:yes stop_codon:yes gene_type:complete